MIRGQRVVLTSDYRNEHGFEYKAGQTGRIAFVSKHAPMAAVELDGYEAERESAEQFRKKYGESVNIVEYYAMFPISILSMGEALA